ncbi:heterokaryon incompatibility protein-domain-containing protein [Hyaloscypha sp. PMI_1271]|nr:heterokaryon incompatibility protein-domain-containing protein [Hyaloscypha sp. PMI_1271]
MTSRTLSHSPQTARLAGRDQFRILDLLPGSGDSDIECELRVSSIAESEKYEALSYVWGDSPHRINVTISLDTISITQSLYNALRRLRYPEKRRALWIDQICINQWDKKEKSQQVNLMRSIYMNCSRCIIWLGELPEYASLTIPDVMAVSEYLNFLANPHEQQYRQIPVLLLDNPSGGKARNAFQAMMLHGNPWWSRVWTIQEAILPSSAAIVWGPVEIPWKDLEDAAKNLSTRGKTSPNILAMVHRYLDLHKGFMYGIRGLTISKAGEKPLDALQRWRYREASDPLDKVYALIGLFSRNPFASIQSCSYDISPAQLFSCVTLDLIQLEGSLKPLVGRRGEPQLTPGIPSWAIEFTCKKDFTKRSWNWWSTAYRYSWFHADGGNSMTYQSESNSNRLSLRGIGVDRVAKISDFIGEHAWEGIITDEFLIATVKRWRLEFINMESTRPLEKEYVGGGSLDDSFWRTVLWDIITDDPVRRPSDEDMQAFLKFLDNGYTSYAGIRNSLSDTVLNQLFFVTERGYIGIGPPTTLVGDEAWILFGGNFPFILRERSSDETCDQKFNTGHVLIGDAYIHGIMDGEFVMNFRGNSSEVFLF